MDLLGLEDVIPDRSDEGIEQLTRRTRPVGERGTIQINPIAQINTSHVPGGRRSPRAAMRGLPRFEIFESEFELRDLLIELFGIAAELRLSFESSRFSCSICS